MRLLQASHAGKTCQEGAQILNTNNDSIHNLSVSKSISNPHSKDGVKTAKNIVKVTENEEGETYSNNSINRTKESEADDAALKPSLTYGKSQ